MSVILILLVCLFFFVCHHVCLSKLNKFDILSTLALKNASIDINLAELALKNASNDAQFKKLDAERLRLIDVRDNLDKSQDKKRLNLMFLWLVSFLLAVVVPCICSYWAFVWPLLFVPILYFIIDSVIDSNNYFNIGKQFGQPPPEGAVRFF